MDKRKLQDVLPPERKSIRAISKDKPVRHTKIAPVQREEYISEQEEEVVIATPRKHKKSFSKVAVSLTVLISVIVLAFAFSLIYASATVKITPKIADVSIDGIYTAKKEAKAGELQYEVMSITRERGEVVPATTGSHVETKARGTIVLYNNYSTTAQTLVTNTRVENSKGQIYKTERQISIPGLRKVDGKTVPGSTEVIIIASEPGAPYNVELTDLTGDFRITAFKGDPKHDLFYGRLKTSLTGGFIGTNKVVAADVAASARAKMRSELKDQIIKDAIAQKPDDFVLYDGAYTVTYETLPQTQKTNQEVVLNERAVLNAILFKEETLNKHIAAKEMGIFTKGNVEGVGLENLEFKISNTSEFNANTGTPLVFSLKGKYKLVGVYPENEVKTKLQGISIKNIGSVLSSYGTISTADVIIRPFWKKSFPDNVDRITIEKFIP